METIYFSRMSSAVSSEGIGEDVHVQRTPCKTDASENDSVTSNETLPVWKLDMIIRSSSGVTFSWLPTLKDDKYLL